MNCFYLVYAYRSSVWKSPFLLHPDCTYQEPHKNENIVNAEYWVLFENLIPSKKNQCVLVSWMPYGRSSRYHSFKQKQGLLINSFNRHSTNARLHTHEIVTFLNL